MILFLTRTSTAITSSCKMNSNDINLFKYTLNVGIIIFTTWIIEKNFSLERIYIAPFVAAIYFCLFLFIKKIKED